MGWCSETEAIIGMYFFAYVGSNNVRELQREYYVRLRKHGGEKRCKE